MRVKQKTIYKGTQYSTTVSRGGSGGLMIRNYYELISKKKSKLIDLTNLNNIVKSTQCYSRGSGGLMIRSRYQFNSKYKLKSVDLKFEIIFFKVHGATVEEGVEVS